MVVLVKPSVVALERSELDAQVAAVEHRSFLLGLKFEALFADRFPVVSQCLAW